MFDDSELPQLFDLLIQVTTRAGESLRELGRSGMTEHSFDKVLSREVKAEADRIVEYQILDELRETGLPILSEETGSINSSNDSDYLLLIDPIDGTANFTRGCAEASVSVGLYKKNDPVFGVLSIYPSGELAWGGPELGAFIDGNPLKVSSQSKKSKAVFCTGIPARFDISDASQKNWLNKHFVNFGKVRMLGAASISLLRVAQGSVDAYSEREIMLWDVAAGLAIVLGAGGVVQTELATGPWGRNVVASNGHLELIP